MLSKSCGKSLSLISSSILLVIVSVLSFLRLHMSLWLNQVFNHACCCLCPNRTTTCNTERGLNLVFNPGSGAESGVWHSGLLPARCDHRVAARASGQFRPPASGSEEYSVLQPPPPSGWDILALSLLPAPAWPRRFWVQVHVPGATSVSAHTNPQELHTHHHR